ncbi:MAG: hypothetical protein O7D86_06945 [Proteobacteria bacterium]|nr:hypothetical protein [Pseudomonadota bacterium]
MKLPCKKLKAHLEKRLKQHNRLPTRIHVVFNDLKPLLYERKQIDVFDLLVQLIMLSDKTPARALCSLLALVDGDALNHLESDAVASIAAFVRNSMSGDVVTWLLQDIEEDND